MAQLGETASHERQDAVEQTQAPPEVRVCPLGQDVQAFAVPEQVRQLELHAEHSPDCTKYPLEQVVQTVLPLMIWHSVQA